MESRDPWETTMPMVGGPAVTTIMHVGPTSVEAFGPGETTTDTRELMQGTDTAHEHGKDSQLPAWIDVLLSIVPQPDGAARQLAVIDKRRTTAHKKPVTIISFNLVSVYETEDGSGSYQGVNMKV